jgi:hypothetical protein
MPDELPQTMSIPEAGRHYYGLCRNASYAAAERGELPLIRVGNLLRVPVRKMERIMDGAAAPVPRSAQSVRSQAGRASAKVRRAKAAPDPTPETKDITT